MTEFKTQHPHWDLTRAEVVLAHMQGFELDKDRYHFLLKRKADDARIWPHIDGFISCFLRQGMYVKHQKFKELTTALDRHFSD
jgi:hypothetical protein